MPKKAETKTEEENQEVVETTEESKEEKTKEKKAPAKKKITQADFEKKVLQLAKEGLTSEKIGEKLRQEGIHPKEQKKKISTILKDKEVYVNPDLKNLEEKLERLKEHYEKNKGDKRAMRDKDRVFAELRKMKKYFKVAIK